MHFSISEFDYLIIQTKNTSQLLYNVDDIENIFKNLTEDNSYPFIVSIKYDLNKISIYDDDIHDDIINIINHNNEQLDNNYISFYMKTKIEPIEPIEPIEQIEQIEQVERFKLSNIAEIIEIIGVGTDFSTPDSDSLHMTALTELKFYEKNGIIVLVASFE